MPRFAAGLRSSSGGLRQRALTASAADTGGSSVSTTTTPTRQVWQPEAWGHYDSFGEFHYGAQFIGSCFSRVKLRLGWINDANEAVPVFNEDQEIDADCPLDQKLIYAAAAVLRAFRDPVGGTEAYLLETMGKNLTVTGEMHLLARDYHNASGVIVSRRWEVLSTSEIRKKANVRYDKETGRPLTPEFERIYGGGRAPEDIPPDAFVLRVYRRHPRWGHLADSSARPLLDTMEVLELLTRQLRATVLSRLAGAGVLFVPSEIDFSDDETAPEGSEQDDPFAKQLIKAMMSPITDRGGPASVVPFVVRADADLIPAIHHLVFDSKDDDNAIAKMDALLLRFAQGMNLPVEVVMGHMNTTFANAVQIDEATYKAHIEPDIDLVIGFLVAGYLWPSLGAERPVDAPVGQNILLPVDGDDITRLTIIADASALVTHANREDSALKLMEMKPPRISDSAGRRALGFNDADAPDDEERDEWIRVQQLIAVRESIRAEETGSGGVSLADPGVQTALDKPTAPPQADNAPTGV